MKKIYSYDNFEGDKGIILADSFKEAKEIYNKEYPSRKIAINQSEYFNGGCYLFDIGVWDEKSKIINAFPW